MRSLQQLTWAGQLTPSVLGFMNVINAVHAVATGTPLPRSSSRSRLVPPTKGAGAGVSGPANGSGDEGATGATAPPLPSARSRASHSTDAWSSDDNDDTDSDGPATSRPSTPGSRRSMGGPLASARRDSRSKRVRRRRGSGKKGQQHVMSNFAGHGFGPAALACSTIRWACDSGIVSDIHSCNKAMEACRAAGALSLSSLRDSGSHLCLLLFCVIVAVVTGEWRQAVDMLQYITSRGIRPNSNTMDCLAAVVQRCPQEQVPFVKSVLSRMDVPLQLVFPHPLQQQVPPQFALGYQEGTRATRTPEKPSPVSPLEPNAHEPWRTQTVPVRRRKVQGEAVTVKRDAAHSNIWGPASVSLADSASAVLLRRSKEHHNGT